MTMDEAVPRLTRKGLATRDRIVAAASAQIFARGVARTSLDDVKAAAGVSSSQLYHYFSDKQALVLAVIEHQTDTILAGQEPLLTRLDSVPALRAWRDALVDVQRSRRDEGGCPIGSIGSELADTDPRARAAAAAGLTRWETGIRTGLNAMHRRGELDGDPEAIALALLTAVEGGLLMTRIRRDTTALEVVLDTIIDHIATLVRAP